MFLSLNRLPYRSCAAPRQLAQFASGSSLSLSPLPLCLSLTEQALQARTRDPKPARRFRAVAARGVEHSARGRALDVAERSGERQRSPRRALRSYRGLVQHEGPGRGEQYCPLNRVAELPHVAGPGMREQRTAHLGRERRLRELILRAEPAEKRVGEQQQVVAPLTERRQYLG